MVLELLGRCLAAELLMIVVPHGTALAVSMRAHCGAGPKHWVARQVQEGRLD